MRRFRSRWPGRRGLLIYSNETVLAPETVAQLSRDGSLLVSDDQRPE